MELKSCQLIAFDKFRLLEKVHFLLTSGFQFIAFFIPLEVGNLVAFVINTTVISGTK